MERTRDLGLTALSPEQPPDNGGGLVLPARGQITKSLEGRSIAVSPSLPSTLTTAAPGEASEKGVGGERTDAPIAVHAEDTPSHSSLPTGISSGGKRGFPGGTVVKNALANAGDGRDSGSMPGLR